MPVTQTFRTTATRYVRIRTIHEGPTSAVWLARDTVAELDVVVKQLNAASATDPVARTRLQEEAAATERVGHAGAVPVIDSMFTADSAALVFPYVPGRTLAERLRDDAPVAQREAARIALGVADVLAAAHAAGIVHRDVKPANVLLGDDGRVRLLDFGIAQSELPLELTGSGTAIGTLPYMAPEQLTGSNPSSSADVFALGIVLYEMLAGMRPFNGSSPAEQLQQQHTPPAALEAPEPLAALVAAMLNPVPAARPSAEQAGRTLRGWLDGRYDAEAATAAVPTVAPASAGASTRRFVGVGLAAAMVLLLGAVTLFGFSVMPAGMGPTDQPMPTNEVAVVQPTAPPTAEPTPTRTPAPLAAAPANQPTTTRSGPSDDPPPRAHKPDHKPKKHGHGHKPKHHKPKHHKPKHHGPHRH